MRAAVAACILATGCAAAPPLQDRAVELEGVPFYPQTAYQYGPAALATVLSHSGVDVSPNDITNEVYLPGLRGSLQVELIATATRHGRIPFLIPGESSALLAELSAGNPVLVRQNKGFERFPNWHYAVVIGYDPDRNRFLLRSGDRQRKAEHVYLFLRSWRLADYWGMVAMPADKIPATATPDAWAQALAATEEFLDVQATETAFRTALGRWPDNSPLLFAAANFFYASGQHDEAFRTYARLLEREPDHVAGRNNFANLLLENGCAADAAAEIQLAMQGLPEEDPLAAVVNDSLERAQSALAGRPGGGTDCSVQ